MQVKGMVVMDGRRKAGSASKRGACCNVTRRRFLELAATATLGLAGATGLAGCSAAQVQEDRRQSYYDLHDDEHHTRGFADDAEVADYPVTIVGYADELLSRVKPNGRDRAIDNFIERYNDNPRRGDVTVQLNYVSLDELRRIAREGCDGDFIIAGEEVMADAVELGVVYAGIAETSVRDLPSLNSTSLLVMRAEGSSVEMPAADTYNGEEIEDPGGGVYQTKVMELPSFKGKVGIVVETQHEGAWARRAFYRDGLYTDESGTGGQIDPALEKVLVEYADHEALRKALLSGECDLGFLFNWDEGNGLEAIYTPRTTRPSTLFQGASLVTSEEGGVVRDFLQYVYECE